MAATAPPRKNRHKATITRNAPGEPRRGRRPRFGYDDDVTICDEFAGVGGNTEGARRVKYTRGVAAANHDAAAVKAHRINHPEMKHYQADVTKLAPEEMPPSVLYLASPVCFPAGTMILTRRGLVPVETVRVGDETLTHRLRWRPVVSVMSREASTVLVRGKGMAGGIETTAEHPFYARQRRRVSHGGVQLTSEPRWVEAQNLSGHAWATPTDFGSPLPVPEVGGRGVGMDADFWWLVGRWLGDGHLRITPRTAPYMPRTVHPTSQPAGSLCIQCQQRPARQDRRSATLATLYCSDACSRAARTPQPTTQRYDLTVSCGAHEAADLLKRLHAVHELRWQTTRRPTVVQFTTFHRGLVEWIATHFGSGAAGKTIPGWVLAMRAAWRQALLDGYLSADGHVSAKYTEASTVSKALAVGIRLLAGSLGHVANIKGPYQRKPRTLLGRTVTERPTWAVSWTTNGVTQRVQQIHDGGYRWSAVRSVEPTGRVVEVFNISVAEDESYLADGIMVHNCPPFTGANGLRVDFDRASAQQDLFGNELVREEDAKTAKRREAYKRARLLMWEPLRYLRAKAAMGTPVLIGVVENVWQARKWAEFDRWRREFHAIGYETELIAFNSMHARPVESPLVPQSRNRLFLAYWHKSLCRRPDFRKWLDPYAHCPQCDQVVQAVKVWKNSRDPILGEMGSYGAQYVYQCPNGRAHGPQEVFPPTLPALAAIDPTLPGIRIGDRAVHGRKPLEPPTIERIRAGMRKYWLPLLVPTGGSRRAKGTEGARPLDLVMPSRTTSECDAVAVPPLMVPVEGRDGKKVTVATQALRSQTTRLETAVAVLPLPFITPLRGGGDQGRARSVLDPAGTVSAGGNHHGLAMLPPLMMRNFTARGDQGQMTTPATEAMRSLTTTGKQAVLTWAQSLLVPYHRTAETARPAAEEAMGTLTTRDRYGVAQFDLLDELDEMAEDDFAAWEDELDINDVLFRMLEPHEIRTAMGFPNTYRTGASAKKTKVRLYGNAVTPAVMECIVSALVECLTGEDLEAAPSLL